MFSVESDIKKPNPTLSIQMSQHIFTQTFMIPLAWQLQLASFAFVSDDFHYDIDHVHYIDCLKVEHQHDVNDRTQQAIGYQKEVKKTLGKTSEAHAYLKFEMTSYVKCQIDI